ncbi:hypothetical protein BXZ70DRAFT_935491 [Cristinia sonorae]|uniref:Peptide hydrolase n=1 Tax=Cristinia sonorae TaxID=1940300 RepID=A0A8K0UPS7_9AGAR|nr:hypothetical protein BXZ70DRAFT_935491 [Cristinia sonorae]
MVHSQIAASTYMLVTAFHLGFSGIPQDTCLTQSHHYRAPGGKGIYFTNLECLESLPGTFMDSYHVSAHRLSIPQNEDSLLLWAEPETVMSGSGEILANPLQIFFDRLSSLETPELEDDHEAQSPFHGQHVVPRAEMMFSGTSYSLLAIHPSLRSIYDSLLPSNWRGSLILDAAASRMIPVPSSAVERVLDISTKVKFDPVIAALVNNISVPQMTNDIRFLTGEDGKSGIVSRHSFSSGIVVAAKWAKKRFEETGASCELVPFLTGFGPNVICKYPAITNTTETVLLSAHYDSRGSFGSTRAPGGDDDGSGTIAILNIARTIARRGITFKKNVELCLFAGEEQGLLGSRAYARELRSRDADLVLMIQADMLAYHAAGEPAQLGLPDIIGTPEVTELVAKVADIYSPELHVGYTPACCSDHQSFHEQGFPSTQVFERAGPIVDPMYHNSGDLSDREGYDFEQVKSIAKVQFATLLHSAGFDLPADDE